MALSDSELLHAAQSGGLGCEQARQDLHGRFERLLTYLAAHACRLNGLNVAETGDIISLAFVAVLDPAVARFDPTRGDKVEAYLRGLVQNAARTHARFVRRGIDKRHDYSAPANSERGLPASVAEIRDPWDDGAIISNRNVASVVFGMASDDERELVKRIFFAGEEPEEVATWLCVDRSTISRRLGRFYRRVRTHSRQLVGTELPSPN